MMTGHLADDAVLDVLEGRETEGARAHVASCPECRQHVHEARQGLALLADVDVPEPSPLYWASFRRQVERRLESPARRLARPALLAPLLAAAAAVAVALWAPRPGPAPSAPLAAPRLPAWSALPPAEEDDALIVLGAVVPSGEDVSLAPSCEGAACLVAELSEEESAALADALRRELPAAREL
jgi:hypothetical protein